MGTLGASSPPPPPPESVAYVVASNPASRVYTVELGERGSGICKLATEDFLRAAPRYEVEGATGAAEYMAYYHVV